MNAFLAELSMYENDQNVPGENHIEVALNSVGKEIQTQNFNKVRMQIQKNVVFLNKQVVRRARFEARRMAGSATCKPV